MSKETLKEWKKILMDKNCNQIEIFSVMHDVCVNGNLPFFKKILNMGKIFLYPIHIFYPVIYGHLKIIKHVISGSNKYYSAINTSYNAFVYHENKKMIKYFLQLYQKKFYCYLQKNNFDEQIKKNYNKTNKIIKMIL